MQKIMGILEKPLGKFSAFIQNNNFTSAIVRGITISIPVTIVGGLATLIMAAPDPAILGEGNFFYGVLALWQSLAQGSLWHVCSAGEQRDDEYAFRLLSVSDHIQSG